MGRVLIWVLAILFFPGTISVEENVKEALVQFMVKLSAGNGPSDPNWGWNISSDPCIDAWRGVTCKSGSLKKIVLDGFNFTGTFDASYVCGVESLGVLSLVGNGITGFVPDEIGNCKQLTHLYISGNKLFGDIPENMSQLINLKRFDISNNDFSGKLPEMSSISGLLSFLVQNNQFSGSIPNFDFSNLKEFNVSNNDLSGSIPDVRDNFGSDSFSGNPRLCGKPLSNACPPAPPPATPPAFPTPPQETKSKRSAKDLFLIYLGYIILVLVVLLLIVLKIVKKSRSESKQESSNGRKNTSVDPSSITSSELKTGGNRSEFSITSAQSGMASSSLTVLGSPVPNGMKFEDLLRAPAELLGRGKYGSLYKVMLDGGVLLAVKRMKDWDISSEDFKTRIQNIDQVRHPMVLPPVAYYCSKQEKLLVYEYQSNGSLFKLLHGSQSGRQEFEWGSRLQVAATIAETLTFMHQEFSVDGIAHGNLKSTNILFKTNMEPCISEYGLMVPENPDSAFEGHNSYSPFKVDVYAFGVILLELLTGKLVQNNGFDLTRWVQSVVREEWTVEVFDKVLLAKEGANEERMVNLLQVALTCINSSPSERPNISQIAVMINTIKEQEDRSILSDP